MYFLKLTIKILAYCGKLSHFYCVLIKTTPHLISPLRISLAMALLTTAPMAVMAQQQVQLYAHADTIEHMNIQGNQRIEDATIIAYLGIKEGDTFDNSTINEGMKRLFATGFFTDVKMLRDGTVLIVEVEENPVINEVVFEGNEQLETEDLENEITLQPRSVYTRTKVQEDVERLLTIYRRSGRYTATITPQVIVRDQNRIDLIYKIQEGPVAKVQEINFIGNERFSSSELQGVIRTSESEWYQFLSSDDIYDPDRLKFDQEMLRRYYVSQGYADFQVKSAHAELSPARDAFYITFVLEEGPLYTLSDVKVDSRLRGSEDVPFSDIILTEAGETYDASLIQESVDALTQQLGNLGYAFVEIEPLLNRNRDKNTIDLTYRIKPGPRVYVERINITGNVRTLDEVIRREFRLAEGDPYNASQLARSEQRLNNLGFFGRVSVSTERGSTPDRTVINVNVEEQSTGEVNIGGGFSSVDGVLADFGVKESNFLGRGQELHAQFTLASRRQQAQVGFTEPYFLGRELAAGFDVFSTRYDFQDESSYDLDRKGINLRTAYNIKERLQHSIYYSFESNEITDVQPFTSRFIRDQEGTNTTSAIGHALVYDDRNNSFNPTDGYYVRLSQEAAGVGGNSKYLRHELRSSYFYPIAKEWTFSLFGTAGNTYGYSDEDIRINDRFFVGGDLIRGFDNAGIGPRDITTNDALGGNTYYAGSMEVRFPLGLPEEVGLTGAAFVDAGSLFGVDEVGPEVRDSSALRASVGIGFAWASPFGPIRLDIASPFLKEPEDETEIFRIDFGTRF